MAKSAPTAPPPAQSRPSGHSSTSAGPVQIGKVESVFEPPRLVINAVEGWGKTTVGAFAFNPIILMAGGERGGGETGYKTLLSRGLVPQIDGATVDDFEQLLATIDYLADTDTEHKTLVLDAAGGFERQLHEYVCNRDFNGEWGDRGFMSYHKGYDVSVADWLRLLAKLDRLRERRRMMVILLCHSKVKTFKNPMGEDYDRYVADMHEKTWGVTHKWADAVVFGTFLTIVDKDNPKAKKGKGVGGQDRILYTQRRDAFDAKNRYGMPEFIDIPDDPSQSFNTIYAAITGQEINPQ